MTFNSKINNLTNFLVFVTTFNYSHCNKLTQNCLIVKNFPPLSYHKSSLNENNIKKNNDLESLESKKILNRLEFSNKTQKKKFSKFYDSATRVNCEKFMHTHKHLRGIKVEFRNDEILFHPNESIYKSIISVNLTNVSTPP